MEEKSKDLPLQQEDNLKESSAIDELKDNDEKFTDNSAKNVEKKENFIGRAKLKTVSFLKNKYNLAFLVVLFLALLIRLKYIGQESIWNDAAVHLWYAIKVIQEPLFAFSRQYLTGDYAVPQTIVAFFYPFTKNVFVAGKIVATIYALVGVVFMYLLGTELRSKFTGLMAAALLAFNHVFWFYSVRPLADSPILVTTIILLYCMVKLEKEKTMKWGVLAGGMFLVAMFTKVQSSLFVFALLIYYLLFKRREMIRNKAVLVSWLIPGGFVLAAHVFAKILFKTGVLDRVFRLFLDMRGMPFGLDATGMLKWIFTWYLVPLVILGALFVILYKEKKYYFSLILFVFYWFFFEVNVDNTQDRYVLPLLSIAIILAVFSLEEISSYIAAFTHKAVKYVLVIGAIIFISWNYYQIGGPLIYNKSFSYGGHSEAGAWLKENVPSGTPIFAGSPRMVRAFAGREYYSYAEENSTRDIFLGGSVRYLRGTKYLKNKTAFENDLANLAKKSDVYLEIDIWEYTQPRWYFPLSQKSLDYFAGLGFKPVKIIQRKVQTRQGLKNVPVIFILKKEKSS